MQNENYRNYPIEMLLAKLKASNGKLDGYSFEELSENFETPEEMSEALSEKTEDIFPVVLELWRRLLPEKQSLTVFCHNLDFLIAEFIKGDLYPEIYESLAELQYFLDENVDMGVSPEDAFFSIQDYVAHDLQDFLFSYILYEIEEGDISYANDLLDGFYKYVEAKTWFLYLKIRCSIEQDPEEGYEKLEQLIETITKEKDLGLELEILYFLSTSGNHSLFAKLALQTMFQLELEEDFLEFANICKTHFESIDLMTLSHQIERLVKERTPRNLSDPFSNNDPDLITLHKILNQKLQVL